MNITPDQARMLGLNRVVNTKPSRPQHKQGEMNGIESRYAEYLSRRVLVGEVSRFVFEKIKFRLAKKTFYTPDFYVVMADGSVEIHEVKGYWEDDARVKIKVAAEMFPELKWVGVREINKTWSFEEF